jgi:hypothetical protein
MPLIAAYSLLSAGLIAPPAIVELPVASDVWVYTHSSDPGSDTILRVWGAGGKSVTSSAGDRDAFSYSYLQFDVSKFAGRNLKSATLVLTCATKLDAEPGRKDWPVEVRGLTASFEEKSFTYEMGEKIAPTDEVFGTGYLQDEDKNADPQIIKINLTTEKSKFRELLSKQLKGNADVKSVSFALTSKFDPAELGRKNIYKFFSKENKDLSVRPKLVLEFE